MGQHKGLNSMNFQEVDEMEVEEYNGENEQHDDSEDGIEDEEGSQENYGQTEGPDDGTEDGEVCTEVHDDGNIEANDGANGSIEGDEDSDRNSGQNEDNLEAEEMEVEEYNSEDEEHDGTEDGTEDEEGSQENDGQTEGPDDGIEDVSIEDDEEGTDVHDDDNIEATEGASGSSEGDEDSDSHSEQRENESATPPSNVGLGAHDLQAPSGTGSSDVPQRPITFPSSRRIEDIPNAELIDEILRMINAGQGANPQEDETPEDFVEPMDSDWQGEVENLPFFNVIVPASHHQVEQPPNGNQMLPVILVPVATIQNNEDPDVDGRYVHMVPEDEQEFVAFFE